MTRRRAVARGRVALLAFSALALAVTARADDVASPFWRHIATPGAERAHALLEAAKDWHARGASSRVGPWEAVCESIGTQGALRDNVVKSAVAEENALARIERARELDPRDPEILYVQAVVTAAWERPEVGCAVTRRSDEALALYDRLATEHPGFQPDAVAFERGLVLTRLGRTQDAASSYERAEAMATLHPVTAALAAQNLAEQRMLSGELPEAVAAYDRALGRLDAIGNVGGDVRPAVLFGRALALERLGEHDGALESARRALSTSGDSMSALRAPDTFFVPRWEVHAYEALAQEARTAGPPLPVPGARPSTSETVFAAVETWLSTPCGAASVTRVARAAAPWLATLAAGTDGEPAARALRLAMRDRPHACPDGATDALTERDTLRRRLAAARSWSRFLGEGGRDARFGPAAVESLARLAR